MRRAVLPALLAALTAASPVAAADRPDVVFADFEGDTYGDWAATGTAFGAGPTKVTLPRQMPVSGFVGKGLVNSYHGGDGSTGTLTSPGFTIARKSVTFRIGGGGHAGKTCVNLVVGGKVVRTTTGPNTQPGGSEELEPAGWDVSDLADQTARLVVVDDATGGWGHVNLDHVVFTDARPPQPAAPASREVVADRKYLHVPVRNGARVRRVSVAAGGTVVREFDVELADGEADWWAPLDVTAWKGQTLRVSVDRLPGGSRALAAVTTGDGLKGAEALYREPLRPQLRFSARRGWLNDPNGLVYAGGEWHLYFQHNPYGTGWGNMHWGHAVSTDLVHWQELPIALYPPRHGDWAFSGSAVVDRDNTSGWKKGDADLLVAAFTSTGRGECIVYSTDRGRTWTEYEKNPVVKHAGRDPRLLWHAPSRRWVMAVYDEADGKRWIAFYTSPDLKAWTSRSRIEGFYECPDLFELPVDGDPTKRKWVLTAADSDYLVGTFVGATFTPETAKLRGSPGPVFYAAQTFSDAPNGRVIQVGWLRAPSPGMPFNQAMSVPLELRLVGTPDGPRLAWAPVKELEALRAGSRKFGPLDLGTGDDPLKGLAGELLEIRADIVPKEKAVVTLTVRGVPIVYDAGKAELTVAGQTAKVPLRGGRLRLTVLADRTVFEVFAADGLVYLPVAVIPKADARGVSLTAAGGARVESVEVSELKSVWAK